MSRLTAFDDLFDRIANAVDGGSSGITSDKLALLISEVETSLIQTREEYEKTRRLRLLQKRVLLKESDFELTCSIWSSRLSV